MTGPLEWIRVSDWHWRAVDGLLKYRARRGGDGKWRVQMNNVAIGESKGFGSFALARDYVDWGGYPCRMGYDRETGEVHE